MTRMSLDGFFSRYAALSLGPQPEALAGLYAPTFIVGGPQGSQAFTNDVRFVEWLRQVANFNRQHGMCDLTAMSIRDVTLSPLHTFGDRDMGCSIREDWRPDHRIRDLVPAREGRERVANPFVGVPQRSACRNGERGLAVAVNHSFTILCDALMSVAAGGHHDGADCYTGSFVQLTAAAATVQPGPDGVLWGPRTSWENGTPHLDLDIRAALIGRTEAIREATSRELA